MGEKMTVAPPKVGDLPKKLFVKIETESGDQYFIADGSAMPLAEMGETIKVGIYQLIEVVNVEGAVMINGKVE